MSAIQVISGQDFITRLQKENGMINATGREAIFVRGNVDIVGSSDNLTSLHIDDIVFEGWVTITGVKSAEESINFSGCKFFERLRIRDCVGRCISIHGCTAQGISMQSCKYQSAFLQDVQVSGKLDLAGLMLDKKKGCFNISGVTCNEMILLDSADSSKKNRWPIVKTDDEALILQLCALGIPVAIDTQLAKKMVAKGLSPAVLRSTSGS